MHRESIAMKQAIIKLAKCLMVPFGAALSLARPAGNVTILMYHRVNDGIHKEISVANADFRWQMEFLKRKGYRVITLDEAVGQSPAGRRGRHVVLTFDDGYEDFYLNAYPVLKEYGYASTVYIVPGSVDAGGVFWWDRDLGESRLMDWAQIEALHGGKTVTFGSHTMTHADLDKLDGEQTALELSRSREALQQRLKTSVRHFAYPRGIVTRQAQEAARALYDTAVSIFDGDEIAARGYDAMRLKRVPVQRSDGRLLFRARLNGWLDAEGWLKKAVGRR
jgi:peptidoglycan/xylan/chitin deacetylase (PgdA/CDA1 family)